MTFGEFGAGCVVAFVIGAVGVGVGVEAGAALALALLMGAATAAIVIDELEGREDPWP